MNRAHTVWLDQLSGGQSGAAGHALTTVALPAFTLPDSSLILPPTEVPRTKWQTAVAIVAALWRKRQTFLVLLAIWQLLRKLRALSLGAHTKPPVKLLPHVEAGCSYFTSQATGLQLFYRCWRVQPAKQIGRVVLLHGYRDHIGRYESVAESLNARGFSVFAFDFAGHGRSQGERGYTELFAHYVLDAAQFVRFVDDTEDIEYGVSSGGSSSSGSATSQHSAPPPTFLYGHSLGGTVALQLARLFERRRRQAEEELLDEMEASEAAARLGVHPSSATIAEEGSSASSGDEGWSRLPSSDSSGSMAGADSNSNSPRRLRSGPARWRLAGLVLSAPALIPSEDSMRPLFQAVGSAFADVLPKLAIASVTSTRISSIPAVQQRFDNDPLIVRAWMTARWGHEMLAAMSDARHGLPELTLPVFVAQALCDDVTSPSGADFLVRHVASPERQYHVFDCDHDIHLDVNAEQFLEDVGQWLDRQARLVH